MKKVFIFFVLYILIGLSFFVFPVLFTHPQELFLAASNMGWIVLILEVALWPVMIFIGVLSHLGIF